MTDLGLSRQGNPLSLIRMGFMQTGCLRIGVFQSHVAAESCPVPARGFS